MNNVTQKRREKMKRVNLILASMVLSTMFLFTSCEDEYTKITFNDLPLLAREFLDTHFPSEIISYIMEDNEIFDHSYEVNFVNGNNVDFNKKTISITKQVIKPDIGSGKPYKITPPKTKSSYRTIPLQEALLNDLKKLKDTLILQNNFNESYILF